MLDLPVGTSDDVVDHGIRDEMRRSESDSVLNESVRPSGMNSIVGPNVVRVLCQQLDQLFHSEAKRETACDDGLNYGEKCVGQGL